MKDNKKYYWLKLKNDFFIQPQIKKLRKVAGGDTYTIIFQKIMLLSITNGGLIAYQSIEPTIEEELALILDENVEDVKMTIAFMNASKLWEITSSNEYLVPSVVGLIGSEVDSAERVRKFRIRQEALLGNADVTKCNTYIRDKSKEKDIELELDKEKEPNFFEPEDGITEPKEIDEDSHLIQHTGSTVEILNIFEYWKEIFDRKEAILDKQRRYLIKGALMIHGFKKCKDAVSGCAKSDWHKQNCATDLKNIFKDAGMIEMHITRLNQIPQEKSTVSSISGIDYSKYKNTLPD